MKKSLVRQALLTSLILAVAVAVPASPARSTGTALIRQPDGAIKIYKNVYIRVNSDAMALTSSDGEGMLIIGKAACTHIGELVRCLPYDATLNQNGQTLHIYLKSGTVWVNPTKSPQSLTYSSAQLGPHGVLVSLNTKAGTYVSLTGTIDEIQK